MRKWPCIMELGRAFMSEMRQESNEGGDSTFYSAWVTSKPKEALLDSKGNYITPPQGFWHNWDAEFNIRYGNTQVHLHAGVNDPQLKTYEKKLKALRNAIRWYVKEFDKRIKKHGKDYPPVFERQWLNEMSKDTPFTGYFMYTMDEHGHGKFFIADCHRSINMWMDVYDWDGKPNMPSHTTRNLNTLRSIADNLDLAIKKLDNLRKRYRNGELTRMEPKEEELNVKVTHF